MSLDWRIAWSAEEELVLIMNEAEVFVDEESERDLGLLEVHPNDALIYDETLPDSWDPENLPKIQLSKGFPHLTWREPVSGYG